MLSDGGGIITITTLDLVPLTDEQGRNDEARGRYLKRVMALGPAVPPKGVLLDWFQEHREPVAKNFAFLDLSRIEWVEKDWPLTDMPGAEVFRGGAAQMKSVMADLPIRSRWLLQVMLRDRTWPMPPILLETDGMAFLSDPPAWLQRPLHLAEGYHRLAALHHLRGAGHALADAHRIWVGRPAGDPLPHAAAPSA